jgi:hypothetical protein
VTPAGLEGVKLDDYDAVALANVTDFSAATVGAFQNYLRRGGGLLVFLGANVSPAFYNEHLFRPGLLPAELGAARGEADRQDVFLTLQPPPYDHPLVSIWNDSASGTLSSARFFRSFELKLPAAPAAGGAARPAAEVGPPKVVLRFADGTPALVERLWGLGRVVLFASTAKTSWNDLAVRPAYIPLVHRALGSIVQRQDEGLNVRVGQKFVYRAPAELLGRDALVLRPGQKDDARDSRRVELVGGWPLLQFEETDAGGAYEVAVAGDPPTSLRFAAQPDWHESSLDQISPSVETQLGAVSNLVRWSSGVALENAIQKERVGTEYWMPLAVLALILATAETLLAHWFSKSK